MKRDGVSNTLLLLILIAIAFLLFKEEPAPTIINTIIRDTIIKKDTIKVERTRLIKKITRDTIWRDDVREIKEKFVLSLDTSIQKTTINLRYWYPEDSLSLKVSVIPDTIRTIILQGEAIQTEKSFYQKIKHSLSIGAGILAGFFVGIIVR